MTENNLFRGGVPTDPDIEKLRKQIGVPKENQVLTFDELEKILGEHKKSSRFSTVVQRWKNLMNREHNIVFGPVRSVGIIALPPNERVQYSAGKYRFGLRQVGKAGIITATTDRSKLSDENQRVADHIQRSVAAIKLAAATSSKQQALPSLEK